MTGLSIVNPTKLAHLWKKQFYDLKTYLPMKKEKAHLRFAHGQEISIFPFLVSGNDIDQASSKLLILGHPFFYHHEPKKICNSAIIFKRKSQVAILGAQYNDASDDRFWFKGTDIQWATQWLFRNSEHPILNEFCAVPTDISALLSDFQAFKSQQCGHFPMACTIIAPATMICYTRDSSFTMRM
jgi:hypothetical protein